MAGGPWGPNGAQPDWAGFRKAAQSATQGINQMPFVLDPQRLSPTDAQANKGMMYPALAQMLGTAGQQPGNPLLGSDPTREQLDAQAQALGYPDYNTMLYAQQQQQQSFAPGIGG